MQDTATLYWIWLAECCGVASPYANLLCDLFSCDAERIYATAPSEFASYPQLSKSLVEKLSNKDLEPARKILQYCRQNGVSLLHPAMTQYPNKLRNIERRPLVLYYKGRLPDFDEKVCISVVGTRRMTEYGKRAAYTLSYDMAKARAVVISGMAAGVDGMAHRGALDAGGQTVAVLGCGIDRAYPAVHKELMRDLCRYGTVITEYRPFTPPMGANFPLRNRIISALSQGVTVIEADLKSGAMITARYALYQGKDLFAVPGKIGEQNSDGVHRLLKDGAKLVTDALDILEEYQFLYGDKLDLKRIPRFLPQEKSPLDTTARTRKMPVIPNTATVDFTEKVKESVAVPHTQSESIQTESAPMHSAPNPIPQSVLDDMSESEKAVFSVLDTAVSYDADTVCRKIGCDASAVATALTLLELKQVIQALPGGLYRRL